MIDDGKTVHLTPAEYERLRAQMARAFTDEVLLPLPWKGPREVYLEQPQVQADANSTPTR